jgi:hypothetical protein
MSVPAILVPIFVQVALTFALVVWLGRTRVASLRRGEVRLHDVALGERAWPKWVMQVGNAYHNQFETPVLFYVVVAFAMITRQADLVFVALSWIFVALRLVHVAIHVTSNVVVLRFRVFVAATLVLMAMWVYFAVKILAAPLG